ncbi:MAG: diphosphate--fructose-6-phosphate 1-phosphotransferase [Candidatus Algichlamydia australiensis]|nr:diphosphate--fructose-6-phosphate 1-phosphotransferase [Chlamydiales bacterium]
MGTFENQRKEYKPTLPAVLKNLKELHFKEVMNVDHDEEIKERFPLSSHDALLRAEVGDETKTKSLKVGVVFSGGQASGGHNVITGLFDGLKKLNENSELIGFLGGPSGIIENRTKKLDEELLQEFRNMGGFDLIGSGRTKIETDEQFASSLETVKKLELNGLVIIGGDDSNTNAALLDEYLRKHEIDCKVVGVPKTIDGDLQNEWVQISFGFDSACRVYSEMIGNIERDCLSAKKYTHFVKLMGRSASHIALECALATQPNKTIIGEEVARDEKTLSQITYEIASLIEKRSAKGKDYGVILIPEGLIEFIPEVKALIAEINKLIASGEQNPETKLSEKCQATFSYLPERIQKQLLLERDPHGNVQVSKIDTQELLIETVTNEIKKHRDFKGKFNPVSHFFGYEGRAGYPTNFDATYCYALGQTAALLIEEGHSGFMAALGGLTKPPEEWEPLGVPITSLMHFEMRKGKRKPVISKALVDLSGKAFRRFAEKRSEWAMNDAYLFPGPTQYSGDETLLPPHIIE